MAPSEKIHASFPQLKYPSLRDVGPKDPTQWLEGKIIDDDTGFLWRVGDKLYDMTNFIDKHPGGRDWLHLTKGTDITEAFESHHISEKPAQLLSAFYVKEATRPRNSPFTFADDGFYRTLKRRIRQDLDKLDVANIERRSKNITDSLFAAVLILSALSCVLEGNILMPVVLFAGLSVAWVTVAAHNYFHKKDNWRMYLFNLSTLSYRDWRISHALSHHLFPNTLFDLEISGFEPFLNWLPNFGHGWTAFLISPLIYLLMFWVQSIRKVYLAITKDGFFKHYCHWDDLTSAALPVWMLVASGADLVTVLSRWVVIVFIASFIFGCIGINAAHHHPDIFHDGDEPINTTLDWGVHQLESVMDRVDINGSLFKVMTNFGDHGIHHLFPSIDHAVLPLLYPTFFEVCEEFETKLKMNTQLELIFGQFRQLFRSEIKNRST